MKTLLNAGKQPESLQKRKMSLNLVSIIVDRFLLDNNFSLTRSTFLNEASSLIANQHVSKSLLSLENMLDEYICLKEEKASLHRERVALMQEKIRIQMLLRDMQNAVNTFDTFQGPPPPNVAEMNANPAMLPQSRVSPSGVAPVNTTPLPPQNMSHIQSLPMRMNTNVEAGNFSAPMISASDRKRRDSQAMDVPTVSKKRRGRPPGRKNNVQGQNILPSSNNTVNDQVISTPCSATQSSAWNCALGGSQAQGSNAVNNQVVITPCSATQSSAENCALGGSQVQRSSVVKSLFNPLPFPTPTNSPVLNTPCKTNPSHNDTCVSPLEISPITTCNGKTAEQLTCLGRSQCISPINVDLDQTCEKDLVSSRLDTSNMHESLDKSLPDDDDVAYNFDMGDISSHNSWDFDVHYFLGY
ncbi:uncharacterized protein LOC109793259 isoform X2 [Cajanus cajan]|uniref:uncharacterized protein LOC109793259 isoform X2 n=1 Tax=Cajanus cajan TaxID=3821 RepID=UPI0010FB7739|nr:uncharacterized protein LOC109793259 isoform X2 [Cajanus cajan]